MKIADYEQMMAHLMRQGYNRGGYVRLKTGGSVGGVKYLFSKGEGQGFRVLAQDKTAGVNVDKFFKRDQKDEAIKFAKEINKKVEKAKKGFLTRSELAKKLGITPGTIEAYKSRNAEAYKKIKELFEVKKAGATSPELYKPKTKTAVSEVKKVVDVGMKKPTVQYRGEKTIIQRVRDILDKSDKPLTEPQIIEKIKGVPKATVRNAVNTLIKENKFKNKVRRIGPAEAAANVAQIKAEKRVPLMKAIRDQFVADPESDLEDVAKAIYGDKKFNNANNITKEKYLKDASRQVPKFLSMFSPGSKLKYPGFKDIEPNKLGEILTNIEIKTNDFGFEPGTLRTLRNAIADAARGLPERATETAQRKLTRGAKAVDEVAGTAATFERAPGYIEATQIIDSKINQIKGKRLDPEFSRVFNNALAGDFSEVGSYNKKARDFGKQYNIDVPIIKTGKNLKPEKIISNFSDFSPGAQKNIKDIAKEKGVVVQTKSKPLFSITQSSGPTLGANIGLLKGVGETIKAIPTPTGGLLLNLAFRPDLSSGIDRAALGAEAAFAPELVRQTSRVSSAPIVQRFFNLGLSPQLAARAARVVSPLGLTALAGEGVYQLGRLGAEQRRRMQEMTPRERQEFDAEQQSISEFAAAGGGIAKLAGKESGPPPEKGPDSEGLASLLKNVKKR